MAKRRAEPEPLLWLLFSSGGLAAALLLPVLLLLFGLVFPAGWVSAPSQAHLLSVASFPLTRIVLLGLCVLALFHWAHRFRYTLYDGLLVITYAAAEDQYGRQPYQRSRAQRAQASAAAICPALGGSPTSARACLS